MRRLFLGGLVAISCASILGGSEHLVLSQVPVVVSEPTQATTSPPLSDLKNPPVARSSEFVVIQGHVTDIKGDIATVSTFNLGPGCAVGQKICPASPTKAGTTFKVDRSKVVFQSADSSIVQEQIGVGDPVIVAGRPTRSFSIQEARQNPPTIRASVIQRVLVKGQLGYYPAPIGSENDISRFAVSFYSPGNGIDEEIKNQFDEFLKSRYANVGVEKINWGREGEINYCFKLRELSTGDQARFIKRATNILGRSNRVNIYENKKCSPDGRIE